MTDKSHFYQSPCGYSGIGSDIGWCERQRGGKFCMYCRHRAKFEEWSKDWHWYYLLEWHSNEYNYRYWKEYAHFKIMNFLSMSNIRYINTAWARKQAEKPKRYRTAGLKESDLKSLLRKGCKPNRKCKCVSVAQRGAWYCPKCYRLVMRLAKHRGSDFHDLTVTDRNELKEDILILLLSGTI